MLGEPDVTCPQWVKKLTHNTNVIRTTLQRTLYNYQKYITECIKNIEYLLVYVEWCDFLSIFSKEEFIAKRGVNSLRENKTILWNDIFSYKIPFYEKIAFEHSWGTREIE